MTWVKDGQPIVASSKNVLTAEGEKSFKLEVCNVTAADIGQYGVTVAGKKNQTSAFFSLNVAATEI